MFKKIQRLISTLLKQKYAKSTIYYIIASIIGQGVVLISSAIFTRIMGKNDYGLISTYSTWVLILNTFICLNLFITVRNAYIDFRNDYDHYNSSILILNLFIGIVFTLAIAIITKLVNLNFSIEEAVLACVQSVALNIINYMLAIQAMKNEYKQRAFLMTAPNWSHILLSLVLMLIFTQNMYMAKIYGNALGMAVFAIGCIYVLFKLSKPKIIPKYWKYALKISIPSIFNTLSDLLLMQCDRLMLTSMVSAEETAEYSVIYNVSSIIVVTYQAINGAWTPWFYKKVQSKDRISSKKYQAYYIVLFTAFTCGMMTVSPELIKIISPANYWNGIRYVAPIIIANYLIFLYSFFTNFLMYKKQTGKIAKNTAFVAFLNIILNYILIPQYKSTGAVIATVISYMTLLFLHFFSAGKDGSQYLSVNIMWLNTIVIVIYALVFYCIRDLFPIRYLLFIISLIFFYKILGKKYIKHL